MRTHGGEIDEGGDRDVHDRRSVYDDVIIATDVPLSHTRSVRWRGPVSA